MKPRVRWPLLVALLASAPAPAFAKQHPVLPVGAIQWQEPAHGAVLQGGAPARFAWRPGPEFDQLDEAEEWELFLSVDGGQTWPIRLTPHLSTGYRSAIVEIPNLAVEDGRLLLRMGNEKSEYEVALAAHVDIRPDQGRQEILPLPAATTASQAPPANEAGVAIWAVGDRYGNGIRWQARSTTSACGLIEVPAAVRAGHGQAWCLPEPRRHRRDDSRLRHVATSSRDLEPRHSSPSRQASAPAEQSPRTATCRSNR